MTKADLVKIISENTGIIRKDVAVVVDAFLQAIKDSLIKGNHIDVCFNLGELQKADNWGRKHVRVWKIE